MAKYAVHASIVLLRSRFAPLNSIMGEGRSEMGDSQIL